MNKIKTAESNFDETLRRAKLKGDQIFVRTRELKGHESLEFSDARKIKRRKSGAKSKGYDFKGSKVEFKTPI